MVGFAEVQTDPMGPNMGDTYVFLKPSETWTTARSREELVSKIEDRLKAVPTQAYSFSQPIEFRMQELIEGVGARSDVVIKVFGEDLTALKTVADETAGDVAIVEQHRQQAAQLAHARLIVAVEQAIQASDHDRLRSKTPSASIMAGS